MVVAGSGENVPTSACPIHVQLARHLGILLARAVVVHHKEHIALQQFYVGMCCPADKVHHLPVGRPGSSMGVNNLCNVVGILYCTLHKHQM